MQDVKYICLECGHESKTLVYVCPGCQTPLVASCLACGSSIVGAPSPAGTNNSTYHGCPDVNDD